MLNIAILDNQKIFCQGLKLILQSELSIPEKQVMIYTNTDDFWKSFSKTSPDLILIDVNIHRDNGSEICEKIKEHHPKAKIMGLSVGDKVDKVLMSIRAGIDAYLFKDCDSKELVLAIQKVIKGEKYFDAAVVSIMVGELNTSKKQHDGPDPASLSVMEKNILNLISAEYTQDEIAEKLKITHSNVIYIRRNLLAKFGVKNTAGLMRKAIALKLIDL